jgi:tetratricopeptide (TPR) repeat protein
MGVRDRTTAENERVHGVAAILEGQVYRAGDELRITTQLVDASRDVDLWSETYDRELSTDQIFDVQEAIAEQITSALEAELTPGEAARIREVPTESMDALDAFLRGRSALDAFSSSRDPRDIDRGIRHLRDAVRRDSTLAEAHARLAEGFVDRYGTSDEDRWLDSASVAVDRSRALDPGLTSALVAEARIHLEREELTEARTLLLTAVDREPSNAEATSMLGQASLRSGQPVETVRWAHRLVRLAPRDWAASGAMGWSLELVGFTEPAKAWHERSLETAPDHVGAYGPRATLRSRTDPDEALGIIQAYLDRHPDDPVGLGIAAVVSLRAHRPALTKTYLERETAARRQRAREGSPSMPERVDSGVADPMRLGMAEILQGNEDRGRALLRDALESARSQARPEEIADRWGRTLIVAELEAALGEHDQALRTLERGLERTEPVVGRTPMFSFSLADPYFDSLRSDPRFREIEAEVERRREAIRNEIRDLGIDLYPPGSDVDVAAQGVDSDG